ncbi:MAG TPA: M1 family metallopeptidase [Mycobacteriales bacterium]
MSGVLRRLVLVGVGTLGLGLVAAPAPAQAAACVPAQVVANPGFESGATSWTASAGVIGAATTSQPAHSGTSRAWLDGYGTAHTDTVSQTVTLPAECTTASLAFWLHIDTRETGATVFDRLTVALGGTTVATFSNTQAAAGYQQRTANVSAFAGRTVALTFTGVEDASAQTSFVLDDVALTVSGGTTPPPPPPDATRTPDNLAYTVNLASDATGATWTGTERVSFTNVSATALAEVYLRLWDNFHGSCPTNQPIKITNLTGGTAGALEVGCTAMKVTLPTPLAQGQSGTIAFSLAIAVPNGSDRFGRSGAYAYIGNALPVVDVRDGGGWQLSPYTNNGEAFYTLAANFTVTLDHPTGLLTPATGTSTEAPGAAGRTVTTATATKVRDFAWAAGPFSRSSTTSAAGTRVNTYWTSAISAATAASLQTTSANALDQHASRFGAYPYGEADVVLDNTFWFGGMEYPGFVLDSPSATAAIHELAHQWWYGIVGDDEYANPWLDESFADYSTDLVQGLDGTGCWHPTWQSTAERISNPMSYWDAHPSRYGTVVYGYGKCMLHDLRRTIGTTAMTGLLRNYAASHWFGVSTPADFKAAAQAATTVDLTSFWTTHRV